MIIFVGGLIGAGKSCVARRLAEHLSLPYYDIDEVKKEFCKEHPELYDDLEQGIPFSKETRLKVYDRVIKDFEQLAKEHQHIVVEDALHKQKTREYIFNGARKHFGEYVIIFVRAAEDIIIKRLTENAREGHLLDDPVKMHNVFLKEFEPFEEDIIVCRNNSNLDDTMADLATLFNKVSVLSRLGTTS
jgi:gluconate kinase